jgi:hypothetical protein
MRQSFQAAAGLRLALRGAVPLQPAFKFARLQQTRMERPDSGSPGPDNDNHQVKQVIDLKPGRIIFVPQGWFHAI